MKILSINVGIWTRNAKRSDPNYWKTRARALRDLISSTAPDVLLLQELWIPHSLYIPKGYRKVGGTGCEHPIYVRKGVKTGRSIFRLFWSMAEIEGYDFYNVHTRWEAELLEDTCRELRDVYRYTSRPSVIAGDFNNSYSRIASKLPELESARVLAGLEPADTFANFTRPAESHGEIDHVFTSSNEIKRYALISSFNGVRFSDHSAVLVEF